jgi:hypothetical protein
MNLYEIVVVDRRKFFAKERVAWTGERLDEALQAFERTCKRYERRSVRMIKRPEAK